MKSLTAAHMPKAKGAVATLCRVEENRVLQPWDIQYYNQFIPAAQQQYLKLDKVFEILDYIFYNLFGISLETSDIAPGEVWHSDVCKLNVVDSVQGTIGSIYCDLFEREDPESPKFDHPAHFTIRCSRKIIDDDSLLESLKNGDDELKYLTDPSSGVKQKYQLPIVVLVTSFRRPKTWTDLPLLHLKEIETVFHEMGHALHSMIARTDFQHVSGTRVPVDFVEVPSIFMETFASKLTFNKSGPSIDLKKAVNPSMAEIIETHNQIQLSILDQNYHTFSHDSFPISSTDILANTQSKYHCIPYIPGTAWQVHFSHLYSYGSYYYSYAWSKRWSCKLHDQLLSGKSRPEEWREAGDLINTELFGLGGSRSPWVGLQKLGLLEGGEEAGLFSER